MGCGRWDYGAEEDIRTEEGRGSEGTGGAYIMICMICASDQHIRLTRSRIVNWLGRVASVGGEWCTQGFGGDTRRKETISRP